MPSGLQHPRSRSVPFALISARSGRIGRCRRSRGAALLKLLVLSRPSCCAPERAQKNFGCALHAGGQCQPLLGMNVTRIGTGMSHAVA